MSQPPKAPEPRLTILDDKDISEVIRRLDDTYVFLVDLLMVYRRVPARRSQDGGDSRVVPFRAVRYRQGADVDKPDRR